jgi:hypothetical protein
MSKQLEKKGVRYITWSGKVEKLGQQQGFTAYITSILYQTRIFFQPKSENVRNYNRIYGFTVESFRALSELLLQPCHLSPRPLNLQHVACT